MPVQPQQQQKPPPIFFFIGSVALASALAFVIQAVLNSPISPELLVLPSSTLTLPTNNILQSVVRIGEGVLLAPEDVAVGRDGTLYTATRDGWIKRMHRNGSWEDWKLVGGRTLLGIAVSAAGDVLVCDSDKGLLRVGDEGVTLLTSEVAGSRIRLADDVVEAASDGSIYFSVASTKFGLDAWHLDLLEAKTHGQLLRHDPSTNTTSVLLGGLVFANGVALSSGEDFLVVCETWRFRCLKYWLKGQKRGQTEIFIENLPGGPDNINLAPDGSFWIALIQIRTWKLDLVHRSKLLKHVLAASPMLFGLFDGTKKGSTVINVAADGKRIVRAFGDPDGKVMSFVTSAVEFEGHLYVSSLITNFIGKLSLEDAGGQIIV